MMFKEQVKQLRKDRQKANVPQAQHFINRRFQSTEIGMQFLTTLPDKQWFIDKLNKSIAIAQKCDGEGR